MTFSRENGPHKRMRAKTPSRKCSSDGYIGPKGHKLQTSREKGETGGAAEALILDKTLLKLPHLTERGAPRSSKRKRKGRYSRTSRVGPN